MVSHDEGEQSNDLEIEKTMPDATGIWKTNSNLTEAGKRILTDMEKHKLDIKEFIESVKLFQAEDSLEEAHIAAQKAELDSVFPKV
ncbi:hypothetical protein XU18_0357 [Perkinsela sp. CCAP 1560/4]|nr:hypothetical protein XU18_0357 [Perkinsela sp. CCAP 1560/4]|eukprot:KNH09672.1 hypothetical protein XU18_0357 [Perkinsela sp. CCAP 1560/4]